jgi:hypothetical protein
MSWIDNIQGLRTLKSFLGTTFTQRSVLKIGGMPISDNGSETVLNGVQSLAGTGSWDGVSGVVLVNGSGVRTITIPDPTDAAAGVVVRFVDAVGNSGSGAIGLDPSGAGTIAGSATASIGVNGTSQSIVWISAGKWQKA